VIKIKWEKIVRKGNDMKMNCEKIAKEAFTMQNMINGKLFQRRIDTGIEI
jgi:hypothetical protein